MVSELWAYVYESGAHGGIGEIRTEKDERKIFIASERALFFLGVQGAERPPAAPLIPVRNYCPHVAT